MKQKVCGVPLSQPLFTFTLLFIWTLTCISEVRQAVRLAYALLYCTPNVSDVDECIQIAEDSRVIAAGQKFGNIFRTPLKTQKRVEPMPKKEEQKQKGSWFFRKVGLTPCMKMWLSLICFLPRFAALAALNFLGCRWLLSTVSLSDLFLILGRLVALHLFSGFVGGNRGTTWSKAGQKRQQQRKGMWTGNWTKVSLQLALRMGLDVNWDPCGLGRNSQETQQQQKRSLESDQPYSPQHDFTACSAGP